MCGHFSLCDLSNSQQVLCWGGWGVRYIAVQFEAEILLYIFDHRWLRFDILHLKIIEHLWDISAEARVWTYSVVYALVMTIGITVPFRWHGDLSMDATTISHGFLRWTIWTLAQFRHIPAYSGIFRHIPTSPFHLHCIVGIVQPCPTHSRRRHDFWAI